MLYMLKQTNNRINRLDFNKKFSCSHASRLQAYTLNRNRNKLNITCCYNTNYSLIFRGDITKI